MGRCARVAGSWQVRERSVVRKRVEGGVRPGPYAVRSLRWRCAEAPLHAPRDVFQRTVPFPDMAAKRVGVASGQVGHDTLAIRPAAFVVRVAAEKVVLAETVGDAPFDDLAGQEGADALGGIRRRPTALHA